MFHRRLKCSLIPTASACLLCLACASPSSTPSRSVQETWESRSPQPDVASGAASATAEEGMVPAAATAGTPPAASHSTGTGQPIMTVNGRPIERHDFVEQLIESHGLELAEQMVLTAAARGRAEELGITITPRDVENAHEDALQRMAGSLSPGEADSLDGDRLVEARRLLDEFLIAKNISRLEWDMRMEQNAALRKIAEAEVAEMPINEDMLKQEFEIQYGPRVQVRHIQLSSKQRVSEVRRYLNRGADFDLLARKYSENQVTAVGGGLLPPFSRFDPAVTPLIREAAFELAPGQVSLPIHEGNWFHILKLEQKIPARLRSFNLANRNSLATHIRDRLTRDRQEALEAELFQSARVFIKHPELRRQFEKKHR